MERYYARLRELNMGAIITDAAGKQDVLHMHLTIPKAFVGSLLFFQLLVVYA